jgi:hypothetical protein
MNFNEMKKEFRKTKQWRDFTRELKGQRKVDALTLAKLRKGSTSHHLDLNPDNYTDLSPEKFETLNIKSHEVIHFMYNYYKKDPAIIDRLKDILHKMVLLNGDW